ncbi:MAG: hypothetical protein GX595_15235 [Lentisphaerae bacterium]|nr:hypothetical protein [Lentisphaerota bacterium]
MTHDNTPCLAAGRPRRARPSCRAAGLTGVAALLLTLAAALAGAAEPRFDQVLRRLQQAPKAQDAQPLYAELVVEALVERRFEPALDTLAGVFGKVLTSPRDVPTEGELPMLLRAADALLLLVQVRDGAAGRAFRREPLAWLLGRDDDLEEVLDLLTAEDDWGGLYGVVEALFDHDPAGRDEYRRLILALALVWDQPRRPLHPQMGGPPPRLDDPITARYDDARDLFARRRSGLPYRRLSVTALTQVVDTPVPLSELRWVRDEVRPGRWDRNFFDIRYDEARLQRAAYQWPHGAYTLAAIREQGGICVDQAYFAVLAARAWGVPALLFVGEGRRGPHAWFGYMKTPENWEMDVGRYAYDKYAVGVATNPQTNQPLTDHEVGFLCDRALHDEAYSAVARLGRLAMVLQQLGFDTAAERLAERCLASSPRYELPWRVLARRHETAADWRGLADLLARQATAFRSYPDIVAGIGARQAEALRRLGDAEGAERVLRRNVRTLDRDRDDLARALVSEQVRAAYDRGDFRKAREHLEALLRDQRREGQKLAGLLAAYLDLTSETKQTDEAVRFLKRYLRSLENQPGVPLPADALQRILLQALENNGDKAEADRLRRRLEHTRN